MRKPLRVGRNLNTDHQPEDSRWAAGPWSTEAAGIPCAIELADDGYWVVTFAAASISRRHNLTAAILEASGGLVRKAEALELAAAVKNANDRRRGRDEQPTIKRLE